MKKVLICFAMFSLFIALALGDSSGGSSRGSSGESSEELGDESSGNYKKTMNPQEKIFLVTAANETKRLKLELKAALKLFLHDSVSILTVMREDDELNDASDALQAAMETAKIIKSGGPIPVEAQPGPVRRKRQIISLVAKCAVYDPAILHYNKLLASINATILGSTSYLSAVQKEITNLNLTWSAVLAKNARAFSDVVKSIKQLDAVRASLQTSLDKAKELKEGISLLLAQQYNMKADCLNPFDANYLANIPKSCKRIYDLFSPRGIYLKSACLIEKALPQPEAVVECNKIGLTIFIVNNKDTMNALIDSATSVYAKTPTIKLWLNGNYFGPFYGWSVTDRSGHPMFMDLNWYKGINYGSILSTRIDGLALVKFSLQDPFYYVPTDTHEANFYYCEIINPKF